MASRRLSRSAAVTSTVSVARVSHSGLSARTRSEMRDAKRTLSLAARASITGASESGRSLQMLPKPRQALPLRHLPSRPFILALRIRLFQPRLARMRASGHKI